MMKYRQLLYVERPFDLPDITGEMLRNDFRNARASAAGWDCWEADEWKYLCPTATDRLADMLNAIENGMDWPAATMWGKAFS